MPSLTAEQKQAALARRKALETFQTETAKKLASLEQGRDEMKAKLEEVNKAIKDLGELDIEKVLNDVEQIKAGYEQIRQSIRAQRTGLYVSGIEDYTDKFSIVRAVAGVKTGWRQKGLEFEIMSQAAAKAGQVVGDDSAGGWFVPDQVIPDVIQTLYTKSVFIALDGTDGTTRITVLQGLQGGMVRIPKFLGGAVAYWLGEAENAILATIGTGVVTMQPRKLTCLTRFTDEMLKFQGFGFEDLVRRDMTWALAKEIDETVAYGAGSANEPKGITNMQGVQTFYAETGEFDNAGAAVGGVLNYTGLQKMRTGLLNSEVEPDDSFATISSHDYFDYISSLRTLNYSGQSEENAPYLAGLPPLTRERLAQIIGEHGGTTQVPSNKTFNAVSKFTDVFRGNMSEIIFGRWGGIEILEDNGLSGNNFISGQQYVKMQLWCDLASRHPEAVAYCPDARAVA